MSLTPIQFAKRELSAGRFPAMHVLPLAGAFYLTDTDWHMLDGRTYKTKDHAMTDRSRILDRASRALNK